MDNLASRLFIVHARRSPGSDYYLCGAGQRFGAPVSQCATSSPVTCLRCLRKLTRPITP